MAWSLRPDCWQKSCGTLRIFVGLTPFPENSLSLIARTRGLVKPHVKANGLVGTVGTDSTEVGKVTMYTTGLDSTVLCH